MLRIQDVLNEFSWYIPKAILQVTQKLQNFIQMAIHFYVCSTHNYTYFVCVDASKTIFACSYQICLCVIHNVV